MFAWSSGLWKGELLISTDHESPDIFLSLNDFDTIEAVPCNACVEHSPSKILQSVFFSLGLHVQILDPSTEKKIFLDFLCLFLAAKAYVSIYRSIKEFCFIIF